MVKNKIISDYFSMKGWDWKELLLGNWSTVKEIVKFGGSYLLTTAFVTTNPALAAPITVIGKNLLDMLHYYIKCKTKK